jgi:hypothetical protein
MPIRPSLTVVLLCVSAIVPAQAQTQQAKLTRSATTASPISRWRIGMIVRASGGPCDGLNGYVPVPANWPEQKVTIVREDVSPEVKVGLEIVDGGVKVMNVHIPHLAAGQEAHALLTIEILRRPIKAPLDPSVFVFADPKKLPPEVLRYLEPSPKIESRDPKIMELAKTLFAGKGSAWSRVETLYNWVCEHVKYVEGPLKGALAGLNDRTGDCEERSALFVALCRASGVPARSVWVPDHTYSEFYLEDHSGAGRWFSCQSAGTPTFGYVVEFLPILQKGDSFRPPKPGMERQRYMAEFFAGMTTPGGGKPQVEFIREKVAK